MTKGKTKLRFKNIKWKNSRRNQFVSLKWHIILSSVMKCPTSPLHPAGDENHPFFQVSLCVCVAHPLVTW
jgi:hypothetical protein